MISRLHRYLSSQWQRFFGLNITAITPMLFVGGQFHPRQWPIIYTLGVRAVLSLQAERADTFHGPLPARNLRLLVPDFHPPTIEQLDEGVHFIAQAISDGLPVFVHCHAGVGRAPLMAAAYLMARHGLEHQAALTTLRLARPIIRPNRRQIGRLREYEQLLRRRRQTQRAMPPAGAENRLPPVPDTPIP
ncbi:dual specificity protein phosphatase family protein [Chloroflexus sp.]|uniref:dual specificity protein phosphatase family protein n=1 Tax=Chloroflexus sp. TaxID=1904827 RepID=UPI00262378F6|nr:dual specificity protein phosphatase [uncultured Chloroflexus sp.]